MSSGPYRVLFVCTGNSARSIMAEAILNALGGERFSASSAGSKPTGQVNPGAISMLGKHGHDSAGLRSKSWDDFAGEGAREIDIVITVCDNAAGETCPVWPGRPLSAHWGIPDPAAVRGSEEVVRQAFASAYKEIAARIREMLDLPVESMTPEEIQAALRAIGDAREAY